MENKIIYIIDDEETIQKLLTTRLNKLDYLTKSFTDPRELLKSNNLTEASLFLIDIKMPFIDGLTLLEKLRKLGYRQPAIIITGHGDKEAARQAIRLGAYDFIEKPFDMDLIEHAIRRAIDWIDLVLSLEEKVKERTKQLEEANSQLEKLSLTDPLTGLWNRRYLDETFSNEKQRATRYNKPLSLIMVDADDFKHFNDANGHIMGDQLLKKLAETFKKEIRTHDFAARYGGEEFLILLPETELQGAVDLAERIRIKIQSIDISGKNNQPLGTISVSMGISSYPKLVTDPKQLISNADSSLYLAKKNGKNRLAYQE